MNGFKVATKKKNALRKKSRDKILKTLFPKEFFNEIWLKLGDCKCNYIEGIKF